MNKMKVLFLASCSVLLLSISVLGYAGTVSAETSENIQFEEEFVANESTVNYDAELSGSEPEHYTPYEYYIKKENVRHFNQWSGFRRVSPNLKTGPKGGSLSTTQSTSFSMEISGTVDGLGFGFGRSVTSAIGYKLNVGANRRVYIGYRVRYRVETGQRVQYQKNKLNGAVKVVSRTNYTVKIPQVGEYALVNY